MAVLSKWIYQFASKTSASFAQCQTIKRFVSALVWLSIRSEQVPALQVLQVWTDASLDQSLVLEIVVSLLPSRVFVYMAWRYLQLYSCLPQQEHQAVSDQDCMELYFKDLAEQHQAMSSKILNKRKPSAV